MNNIFFNPFSAGAPNRVNAAESDNGGGAAPHCGGIGGGAAGHTGGGGSPNLHGHHQYPHGHTSTENTEQHAPGTAANSAGGSPHPLHYGAFGGGAVGPAAGRGSGSGNENVHGYPHHPYGHVAAANAGHCQPNCWGENLPVGIRVELEQLLPC